MKLWHWALVGLALYEAGFGVYELMGNSAPFPTLGSLVSSAMSGSTSTTTGAIDLVAGAVIFIVPLHRHLTM